ncbi:ABC transporter permease [Chelatococcus sp. GCM10030263]|uniref:ABC transporter permease n=1 Tax=Chelatococcus sp. GCM10030263 TaxID=3273387 RepID=UPI00361ABACD
MTTPPTLATAAPTAALPARPQAWRRLFRQSNALVGGTIVLVFCLAAIAAPLIAPYDPNASDWLAVREAPSLAHLFGTDDLGRDVLSRVIFGARASLSAGVISVVIAMLVGVPFGLIAGYFEGLADIVISRCTDALLACPFLILAIAFAAFLGPSLQNAMVAIGISAMPVFVRLARGQVLVVKREEFVDALRSIGVPDRRILVRHIVPNVLPPLIVQGTLTMAIAVLAEASLAFLGLGQLPPAPSWGSMLDTARQFLSEAPWMAVWPGLAIVTAVIGFNLLGDGLNDVLNPKN